MLLSLLASVVAAMAIPADTVLVLGSRSIDMTGDRRPERLVLIGTGPSIDSLDVTFQIESFDGVLYAASLRPITRVVASDGPRRVRTSAEQAEFVSRFGLEFFDEARFVPASRFLTELTREAAAHVPAIPSVIARHRVASRDHSVGRLENVPASTDTTGAGAIWSTMLAMDRIVFRFSPGGDVATAIAWSDRDRRFYRLLECC
jgi:hypothetical protein